MWNNSKMFQGATASVIAFAIVGCEHSYKKTADYEQPQQTKPVEIEATAPPEVRAASQLLSAYVSKVEFSPTSKDLSDAEKARIRETLVNAKAAGKIDDIKVAVWADHGYPSSRAKHLPKDQRVLAEERGDIIKKYIKDELKMGDVKIYNMAERPNSFQDFFNTSDSKVKNALERNGVTQGGILAKDSASKAVIMVEMEN